MDVKVIERVGNRAFVGFDIKENHVIVVFRGSNSNRNLIQDMNMAQTAYPYCSGCHIHKGFSLIFEKLKEDVRSVVNSHLKRHEGASVRLYGHSLGGALATLCAADLKKELRVRPEFVYTYGQPRVGNEAFATWYRSQVAPNLFRVTHGIDAVPHLPSTVQGYHHTSTEVHYRGKGSKTGYKVCNKSGEDPNCANGADVQILKDHLSPHLSYMDSLGGCDVKQTKISALAREISATEIQALEK